jgi:hypothetical protein
MAACATAPPKEPPSPAAAALAIETFVKARHAEIVLGTQWRGKARVEAIRREETAPGVEDARGSAVFTLEGLRVEAEELRLKWLPDYADLVLHAREVEVFRQRRAQPYETRDIDALTMANDHVSFFQQ